MSTTEKLIDISSRLEALETAAEWIARETTQRDNGVSQSATLITVLADEVREQIFNLVTDLENLLQKQEMH
jgi:hypothetical protein